MEDAKPKEDPFVTELKKRMNVRRTPMSCGGCMYEANGSCTFFKYSLDITFDVGTTHSCVKFTSR